MVAGGMGLAGTQGAPGCRGRGPGTWGSPGVDVDSGALVLVLIRWTGLCYPLPPGLVQLL